LDLPWPAKSGATRKHSPPDAGGSEKYLRAMGVSTSRAQEGAGGNGRQRSDGIHNAQMAHHGFQPKLARETPIWRLTRFDVDHCAATPRPPEVGIGPSAARIGDAYDNALAESVIGPF
ncbi:MAG: hypothetical protein ACREUZ_03580, partial [Burkholderiales bacterium]